MTRPYLSITPRIFQFDVDVTWHVPHYLSVDAMYDDRQCLALMGKVPHTDIGLVLNTRTMTHVVPLS